MLFLRLVSNITVFLFKTIKLEKITPIYCQHSIYILSAMLEKIDPKEKEKSEEVIDTETETNNQEPCEWDEWHGDYPL